MLKDARNEPASERVNFSIKSVCETAIWVLVSMT